MGFKYKKVNERKILVESKFLISKKICFLKKYLQYLEYDNVHFIYLDETWIYQNGSQVRLWVHDVDKKANPSKIPTEGKRFTVLHAGHKGGFLEGCSYLLDSNIEHRDYHRTMNGQLFQTWVEQQLIPALDKINTKVVVIMDNAPYHSMVADKLPTLKSTKGQLQEWLTKKNIAYDESMTKKNIWNIIKPHLDAAKITRRYVIDEILAKKGHDVLRLPPYHCQYNPIEMVWGFCKMFYNKNIRSQPACKNRVSRLWQEALVNYTPEMWANSVQHCENLIKSDWNKMMGNFPIKDMPPIIVNLAESSDDSNSDISVVSLSNEKRQKYDLHLDQTPLDSDSDETTERIFIEVV
jgi:transposase